MSTKVYNGIKFKSKDYRIVLEQLKGLRDPAKEIALNDLKKSQIKVFIRVNDLVDTDPYDVLKGMELSSNKNMKDVMDIAINFTISIFPHKNGNIYGYFFDDIREKYKNILLVDDICEDYHYQNQSDMSNYDWDINWDDIPEEKQFELEKDWKEREEIWEDLMGDGTFAENGFMYDIVDGGRDLWSYRIVGEIKKIQDKLKHQKERKDKLENLNS